jgi:amino acid transporter
MAKGKKFGTFGGVFTPSILTILGVIMYMRLPMISGEAGLIGTLGIILVAHLISISTGLSVSSIATDKKVKEGGTYYIISRSLGLPIGGTLGLALFVGLSFSVSLYLIGFSESFLGYWDLPMDINHIRITGSIILLVVTIITFVSTSLAIKTQYLIMAAIVLSLLSILLGNHDLAPATPNFFGKGTGVSLMVLFGIFFPAVTGFEAGVSMSGDLKDPKKSIPVGTISAIAIGLVVYICLAFFFAYTVDGELLATDPKALFKIALVPQLVIAGIWGATLSSALGSILAAPRILQSTAMDKITPRFFAKSTGAAKEPRNALLLTFLIAEAGILIGELDVIARIVSIFFITTYGFLNLSAAFESLTSADFRPSFKTPPWVSIVGFLACFIVMIQLDFLAMIGAIVILGALFLFLKQRQLILETGDAWSSVWSTLVRAGLRRLNRASMHTRNWRPNIILFSGQDSARPHLIEMAGAICGRLGMYSAFEMIESNEPRMVKDKRYFSASAGSDELIIHQHECRKAYEGMNEISRVYGFSGVEPDTILMGWSRNLNNKAHFLRAIKNFEESDFNTIFLSYNSLKKYGEKKTIDVWWSGWGSNLTFCIFLLRHFTSSGDWKDAHIRLLVINNLREREETIYRTLRNITDKYRISIEIKIINNSADALPKTEIISRESSNTDLTFIGIPDKQYRQIEETYEEVMTLSQHLGTFVLLNSSSRFESFNLGIDIKQDEENIIPDIQEFELPELVLSKYSIINDDISRIDTNGQKVLALFFEKAFAPVFSELQKLSNELLATSSSVIIQLDKLKTLDDAYRIKKSLIKIKNDFYFRANRIFADLVNNKLGVQRDALARGISWYIERLDEDLQKFPQKILIPYEKEDLKLKSKDPFRLKLFILRKLILHPFAKTLIPGKIQYHSIASYYLRNNRHYYLSAFLNKFGSDLFHQYSEVRSLIISVDTMLDSLFKRAKNKDDLFDAVLNTQKANENRVREFMLGIDHLKNQTRNRLLLEWRKNLQQMCNDMGKVDINFRIKWRQRNNKYYEELIRKNLGFTNSLYEDSLYQVNKIHMDVLLQSVKSRIRDKINEYNLEITQQVDNRFGVELESIRLKLIKAGDKPGRINGLKTSVSSVEEDIPLLKDLKRFGKEVLQIFEILPENLIIASSDSTKTSKGESDEVLNVPLKKIARFYIESQFIGTIYDYLETVAESLKNTIFIIHDLLSFTRFSLENIPEDLPDRSQVAAPIIEDACQKILEEEQKIKQIKQGINDLMEGTLEEVFNKLSGYQMPVTLSEYSGFIREQKGIKVKRTIGAYYSRLRSNIINLTARVLYSRSELILLTKKIDESEHTISGNQKLLDLVDKVSPDTKVIEKLPQFYKNLFSGRSSISEDFWIRREVDEEMFMAGLNRNNLGYKGGIMITGERNSGKTAFCRYISERNFKKEKVFHLFPVYTGSARVSDFIEELKKVTNLHGSLNQIMESLPHQSVIIIHDLELWWDRSSGGWEVIKLLMSLINDYSGRVLFIINMNPYAFSLMNKIVNLQELFVSVIPLRPFYSLEIQDIIIRRHRSSGLRFVINGRGEEEISEISMASLFNKYFNYSEGNPGNALKAWLANIHKVSEKKIFIGVPEPPDIKILDDIDEDWKVVIIQLILHKRLTFDRIANIFSPDDARTSDVISAMLRAGLIEEKRENLYIVNNFLEPHLIKALRNSRAL